MLACAHPAFDGPAILFQNIIEALHRSMPAILLRSLLGFEPHDGRWITGVLVGVDDPRRRMVLSAQGLGEKALSRCCVAFSRQKEVDRRTGGVDSGERQKVGGQAAFRSGSRVCGCDLNFGYQRRNRSSRSSLRTLVLVCSKRWAPRSVHCICCFLTNRLLTTWLIVDSTKAVLMVSPCRRRSPKFGMNSRLLQMYVLNSSRPSTTFFAAFERASIKLNSINKSPSRSRASSVFPCHSRCLTLSKRLDTSAPVSGRSSCKAFVCCCNTVSRMVM